MVKTRTPYLGVFENMDFEPYKFREYPKVVGYRDEKKTIPIIVNDAREEVDFITQGEPGAHKTREEELAAELERRNVELEEAKRLLEEFKKNKDALKEASKPLPPGDKKV